MCGCTYSDDLSHIWISFYLSSTRVVHFTWRYSPMNTSADILLIGNVCISFHALLFSQTFFNSFISITKVRPPNISPVEQIGTPDFPNHCCCSTWFSKKNQFSTELQILLSLILATVMQLSYRTSFYIWTVFYLSSFEFFVNTTRWQFWKFFSLGNNNVLK